MYEGLHDIEVSVFVTTDRVVSFVVIEYREVYNCPEQLATNKVMTGLSLIFCLSKLLPK